MYFDQKLWDKLLALTEDKYGISIPTVPTCLHPMSKLLKKEMDTFVRTHTKFVAEVPSFRGEMVISMPAKYISPYISLPNISSLTLDAGLLIKSNSIIAEEAALIFSRIHEVLHVQACEVVVLMICCKDRIQDGIVTNAIPLAYALKGKRFVQCSALLHDQQVKKHSKGKRHSMSFVNVMMVSGKTQ